MSAYRCERCGGPYVKISEKKLGDTTYFILKCQSCAHQVARQS
ncbi:MAG: hypothetical protein ABIC95_03635 [archaeon]